MRIRTKHQLITAALMMSVVVSIAAMVIHTQGKVLRAQAIQRLEVLVEGATRIGKEALDSRDRLMAVSYLMFLQKEHPELAFASVTYGGHTARLGSESEELFFLERSVLPSGGAVQYTISAYPRTPGLPAGDLKVSTAGVSLQVSGTATVKVEEPAASQGLSMRFGFVRKAIDDQVELALTELVRWTAGIAGAFMIFGLFVNRWVSRWLTGPIEELAAATVLVAGGRMDVSVKPRSNDEMGMLTRSFNSMTGQLKELLESREDILHTLTHEINTPLNGLKGYLELWQDKKLPVEPPQQERVLGTMMAAVVGMENTLSNALNLFRSEHKASSQAEPGLVRVDEVIRQTLTLFAPMAQTKGISVLAPEKNVRAYIRSQEEPVRQIVSNLVSNAIKYTPSRGNIRIGLTDAESEIVFYVSNTGYGIPADDIPHLFTKFFRSGEDRASGRRIPGTGLGLNIVHKAVTALGGRIWVESQQGKDTTFLVRLPKLHVINTAL